MDVILVKTLLFLLIFGLVEFIVVEGGSYQMKKKTVKYKILFIFQRLQELFYYKYRKDLSRITFSLHFLGTMDGRFLIGNNLKRAHDEPGFRKSVQNDCHFD